jgi:hypothetical protein
MDVSSPGHDKSAFYRPAIRNTTCLPAFSCLTTSVLIQVTKYRMYLPLNCLQVLTGLSRSKKLRQAKQPALSLPKGLSFFIFAEIKLHYAPFVK